MYRRPIPSQEVSIGSRICPAAFCTLSTSVLLQESCTSIMTPAGVKYFNVWLLQESSISIFMTPAGVKYVSMYDSGRSQLYVCMTPAGVKYFNVWLLQESNMSICMTPARVLQSVAACRIVPNCCRLIPLKCTNPSQRAELRWIVTDWTRESAAIGRSAPNSAELLQIDPAKMQQSGWSRECATIGRTTPNGAELLQIGPAEGHQSVHARLITPNCCRLTPPSIYNNSARCKGLT